MFVSGKGHSEEPGQSRAKCKYDICHRSVIDSCLWVAYCKQYENDDGRLCNANNETKRSRQMIGYFSVQLL